MVARAIAGLRVLRLVVAVFLTVSVNASSDGFTKDTTANGGDETINGQQSSPRSRLVGRVGEFEGELNYYLPLQFRSVDESDYLPLHFRSVGESYHLPLRPTPTSLLTQPLGFPLSTARLFNILPLPPSLFPSTPPLLSPYHARTHPERVNLVTRPLGFPLSTARPNVFSFPLSPLFPCHARTHPERVSLVTRPLGFPLSTARLSNVFLHFFERLPSDNSAASSSSSNPTGSAPSTSLDSASIESASVESSSISEESVAGESASEESGSGESEWAVNLRCHGPPCPAFGSCTARFPNVQACWNPELVDPPMSEPIPPINCPLQAVSAGRGDGSRSQARFDETCSQEQDVGIHGATALQMMRLEDVFVTDSGFALNRTHLFVRNGCPHFPGKVTYDAEHMVHELPTAVFNWAHQPASNFYHFLIEIFPLFLVAAPLMPSPLRQLPVLVRGGQVHMYKQLGAPLIGIPLDQMRLLPTSGSDLFHADVVYQPIFQNCYHPSQSLWQLLRRRHLLHPSGIPLFNPDWTLRNHRPLSPHEARSFPSDWLVVVAKRPKGKRRALVNFGEVEEEVVRLFGRERVVLFDGSLPILQVLRAPSTSFHALHTAAAACAGQGWPRVLRVPSHPHPFFPLLRASHYSLPSTPPPPSTRSPPTLHSPCAPHASTPLHSGPRSRPHQHDLHAGKGLPARDSPPGMPRACL
ncbi:unnamed protein product [Closterium sp. NIES-53]